MKLKDTLLIFFILGFTSQTLCGQEQETRSNRFGLGASIFNLSEYLYEFQSVNSIYLTIDLNNNLRLEPTVGFAIAGGLNKYFFGIGVFKQKAISNFSLLFGSRIGYGNSDVFFLAPAIGGEYYFMDNFSIGSEIQLRGSLDSGDFTLLTNSSILVRFYF